MINTTDIFSMPQNLKTYIYNKLNGLDVDYNEIKTEIATQKLEGEDVGGKYITVGNYIDILTNGEIVSIIMKLQGYDKEIKKVSGDVLRVLNIKVEEIEKLIENNA